MNQLDFSKGYAKSLCTRSEGPRSFEPASSRSKVHVSINFRIRTEHQNSRVALNSRVSLEFGVRGNLRPPFVLIRRNGKSLWKYGSDEKNSVEIIKDPFLMITSCSRSRRTFWIWQSQHKSRQLTSYASIDDEDVHLCDSFFDFSGELPYACEGSQVERENLYRSCQQQASMRQQCRSVPFLVSSDDWIENVGTNNIWRKFSYWLM